MNLEVENVSFRYTPEVVALRDVSLTVESGEAVAILGENGAGKTTLAKHLNGLLKPEEGIVRVGDWDTANHSPAELSRRVSYAFQNPDDQLFERTVRREVAFGPRNLGLPEQEADERIEDSLSLVGLQDHAKTHPYDLHASQRKLVAVAAMLALRAPVVVLDEPTTGQDALGVQRMARIVGHLRSEGRTVIAISHDIDFCAENFSRAVVMADGLILIDGAMATALEHREALARAAVNRPQLARLADALQLPGTPLTAEAFLGLLPRADESQGAKGARL